METLIQQIRTAMEDFTIAVEEIVCEGNQVVTQSTFSGTLVQPLLGFEPVDKMIVLQAATFWKIRHGQIQSGISLLDTAICFIRCRKSTLRSGPFLSDTTPQACQQFPGGLTYAHVLRGLWLPSQ